MLKPSLPEPFNKIESWIIEAMIEGLHVYRADLDYPASHSDMQACVRGVARKFAELIKG